MRSAVVAVLVTWASLSASCVRDGQCTSSADCSKGYTCLFPVDQCGAPGRCFENHDPCPAPKPLVCACAGGTTSAPDWCDAPPGYTSAPAVSVKPCTAPEAGAAPLDGAPD